MKRLLIIVLLGATIFFAGCKKDAQPTPTPVVTVEDLTISVTNLTPTLGSVNPATASVKPGASLTINLLPDSGNRVSSVTLNNKLMLVDNNTVTFSNINSKLAPVVVFTDSLTTAQLTQKKADLTGGKWYASKYAWRATGPLHANDPWNYYDVAAYAKLYYDQYSLDGSCNEYTGSISGSKWTMAYTGQTINLTYPDQTTATLYVKVLNKDTFTYTIANDEGKGKDYEVFFTHVPLQ